MGKRRRRTPLEPELAKRGAGSVSWADAPAQPARWTPGRDLVRRRHGPDEPGGGGGGYEGPQPSDRPARRRPYGLLRDLRDLAAHLLGAGGIRPRARRPAAGRAPAAAPGPARGDHPAAQRSSRPPPGGAQPDAGPLLLGERLGRVSGLEHWSRGPDADPAGSRGGGRPPAGRPGSRPPRPLRQRRPGGGHPQGESRSLRLEGNGARRLLPGSIQPGAGRTLPGHPAVRPGHPGPGGPDRRWTPTPLTAVEHMFYHGTPDGPARVSGDPLQERPEPGPAHGLPVVAQSLPGMRARLRLLFRPGPRQAR